MQRYPSSDPGNKTSLVVLLPGLADHMEDYEARGFIASARREGIAADMVAVDAHYGYYANRTILDRLHQDVIGPAKAWGYRHIWLVAISLGGLGSLLYASRFSGEITGLVLLAPFLGEAFVISEIAQAGGIREWSQSRIAETDYQRTLWRWLKQYETGAAGLPALYLGYGDRDRFALAHRLLAEILPSERVLVTRGRHNWPTWKRLWERFLKFKIW